MVNEEDTKLHDILLRLDGKKLRKKEMVISNDDPKRYAELIEQQKVRKNKKNAAIKKHGKTMKWTTKNPKKLASHQKKLERMLEEQKSIMDKKQSNVSGKSNKEKVLDRYDTKKGKKGTINKVKRIDW